MIDEQNKVESIVHKSKKLWFRKTLSGAYKVKYKKQGQA